MCKSSKAIRPTDVVLMGIAVSGDHFSGSDGTVSGH